MTADDMLRITEIGETLRALDDRESTHYRELAAVLADMLGDDGQPPHKPSPSVRWWELTSDEREAAVAALRAWVEDVYLPGYGDLAAALPVCWPEHDVCLYGLDVLKALWMSLYLTPKSRRSLATLAGQADFQTRTLPLLVSQMRAEGKSCLHGARMNGAQP